MSAEQMEMISSGTYRNPFGRSLHGGDWRAGRTALNKIKILPEKKNVEIQSNIAVFFFMEG